MCQPRCLEPECDVRFEICSPRLEQTALVRRPKFRKPHEARRRFRNWRLDRSSSRAAQSTTRTPVARLDDRFRIALRREFSLRATHHAALPTRLCAGRESPLRASILPAVSSNSHRASNSLSAWLRFAHVVSPAAEDRYRCQAQTGSPDPVKFPSAG